MLYINERGATQKEWYALSDMTGVGNEGKDKVEVSSKKDVEARCFAEDRLL